MHSLYGSWKLVWSFWSHPNHENNHDIEGVCWGAHICSPCCLTHKVALGQNCIWPCEIQHLDNWVCLYNFREDAATWIKLLWVWGLNLKNSFVWTAWWPIVLTGILKLYIELIQKTRLEDGEAIHTSFQLPREDAEHSLSSKNAPTQAKMSPSIPTCRKYGMS